MTDRKESEVGTELWLRDGRHLPLQPVHLQELQLLSPKLSTAPSADGSRALRLKEFRPEATFVFVGRERVVGRAGRGTDAHARDDDAGSQKEADTEESH